MTQIGLARTSRLLVTLLLLTGCGHAKDALYFSQVRKELQSILIPNKTQALHEYEFANLKSETALTWKRESQLSFGSDEKISTLHLYFNGVPIDGANAKVLHKNGVEDWISATVPSFYDRGMPKTVSEFRKSEQEALSAARVYLSEPGVVPDELIAKIYYEGLDDSLRAAYRFHFSIASSSEPVTLVVDANSLEIVELESLRFDLTGKARLYLENKLASQAQGMQQFPLKDLLEPGNFLAHNMFSIFNCEGNVVTTNCARLAQGQSGDFTAISFDSIQYDELVAFHGITRSLDWYRYFAGNWDFNLKAGQEMQVFVRTKLVNNKGEETVDNAAYLPGGGSRAPRIEIGVGWDASNPSQRAHLINLGKDADVFMHEFGHHVVFRSLKRGGATAGQSGALHEGFADYFTYAITGNNQLAESVTFDGVPLREGNLSLTLKELSAKTQYVHAFGQLWSSALWEIRLQLGSLEGNIAKFDKIVWDSIDLLKADAQYYDAIAAITRATDKFAKEHGGDVVAMKEKIFTAFSTRGYVDRPMGNGILPRSLTTDDSRNLGNSEEPIAVKQKEEEDDGICGVIAHSGKMAQPWFYSLLILLVPFVLQRQVKRHD